MNSEHDIDLPYLRGLVAQGKNTAALEKINELIVHYADAELYTLRLHILLLDFKQFDLLADTLGWLKQNNIYNARMEEAETKIVGKIEELHISLTKVTELPLNALHDMLPLADFYPAIHTLHGYAHYRLVAAYNRKHPDYNLHRQKNVHHEVRTYTAAFRTPKLFVPDDAEANAKKSLDAALTGMTDDHPYYVITLKLLADLHLFQEDWESAFDYYQAARELGLPEDAHLESMKPQAAESVLNRLLNQVDTFISNGSPKLAENLLKRAVVFAELPDFQVRQGDVALSQEDAARAIQLYHEALDGLKTNFRTVIQDIDFAFLMSLRRILAIPEVLLKPNSKRLNPLQLSRKFPVEDARHRAIAGLIVAYQKQGDATEAGRMIYDLLAERDLPPEAGMAIIALANQNEHLLQWQRASQLRAQIEVDWKASRWEAAVSAYHELCGLATAIPEDFAWRAVTLVRAGRPVQDILQALDSMPPGSLSKLPKGTRVTMLDWMRGAHAWGAVQRYIEDAKLTPEMYETHRTHLETYLQNEMAVVQRQLDEGQFQGANAHIKTLLAIDPERAELRLFQAWALIGLGDLGTAQVILKQLVDEPALRSEVTLALVEIDLQRGDYQRAQERLKMMDTAGLDNVQQTMHNRIQQKPALLVGHSATRVAMDSLRRVTDETWFATFGVTINNVRAGAELPSPLEACSQFLLALAQASRPDLTTHYAWRYLSRDGKLTIALLCRVEGDSAEAAENGAMALWHTIRRVLPLGNELFAYEPVTSQRDLEKLLRPFEVRAAAEITRREVTVMSQNGDEVYLVYPFGSSRTNLQKTMSLLVESREPVVLDIQFTPTALLPWERGAITDLIGGEPSIQLYDTLPEVDEAAPQDFRQAWADAYYPEFLQRTKSLAFVGMVTLAFAGEIDNALPSVAGIDLFGTSDFEILRALSESELDAARQNLAEVTTERWNYTAAPYSVPRWRHLLTPDEMLTAARLPTPDSNGLPGMPSLKVRMTHTPHRFMRGVVIGESAFPVNGRAVQVTASVDDRLRHTYIVGRTGSGKSTLIQNMALQDIEAGLGVGVIDPHGDLISAILERIPPERAGDVILFDPSDQERPIALNILDVEGEFERNIVISDFIGLMQKMFDPNYQGFVGPRFENIVRHSMMALTEVMPDSTLIDVVRMVSDSHFRDAVVSKVRDPLVLNYWTNIGKQLDSFGWGSAKGEMIDWLTSKFGRFVDDSMMRHIIGQSKNTLDFESIMNNRKILLIDLSKGKIGPQNSHFLGLLLVPRLLIAAHRRARLRPEERQPFCLYVDEFQNFTTTAFAEMLSEARKYGLALTMANQFTSQLEAPIREAVFGNVGSMLAFQVGVKDATLLSPEMHPATMDDLINLPNFHMLAKLLIDSQVTPPFPVRTLADTRPPNRALAETIRANSRLRYGRDLTLVKAEIEQRFKRKP